MNQKLKRVLISLFTLCWMGQASLPATTFLELQSTYLGNGWFQYQMSVKNDPFFTEADIGNLNINFTNQTDRGTNSDNWTNAFSNTYSTWAPSTYPPQPRPYEETFLIRSSETSYRLGALTNADAAMVVFSLTFAAYYPYSLSGVYSANVVGYAMMPALVPCSPAEANYSPTNFVYDLKLLPDVAINRLIQNNGQISGVDFTWGYNSTFLLQGSSDLNTWSNIAYIWSTPPETTWTTNQELDNDGKFFRLAMVAGDLTTNLPPLISNLMPVPKAVSHGFFPTLVITGCKLVGGQIAVTFGSRSGQSYKVQVLDLDQVVRQTQLVAGEDMSTTVNFSTASLPTPAFFRIALQ